MGLLDRFRGRPETEIVQRGGADLPLSWDAYLSLFSFNGNMHAVTTGLPSTTDLEQKVGGSFEGYMAGLLRANGPVFACMALRLKVFSDVRFRFRQVEDNGPGKFTAPTDGRNPASVSLRRLRQPEPGLTTGDLLAHMMQDIDLTGNAFVHARDDRFIRLRPDWVTVIYGNRNPDASIWDLDTEVIGYAYKEGGPSDGRKPRTLLPETVAHWAPIPDPQSPRLGMSWLTPIIREVLGDSSAVAHKLAFFENDATVNQQLVFEKGTKRSEFIEGLQAFKENHEGTLNAYKTLFTLGAELKPVGTQFKDMGFTELQGKAETRIAMAAGVHPVLVGMSEGLQGSSLNAGNFAAARRSTADTTFRPLWRNLCGTLAKIVTEPPDAELWYDDRDCMFLQEDRKDAAEIQQIKATTIAALTRDGFEPNSAVAAVMAEDMTLLKHTGKPSVQLQKAKGAPDDGGAEPNSNGNGNGKVPESLQAGQS